MNLRNPLITIVFLIIVMTAIAKSYRHNVHGSRHGPPSAAKAADLWISSTIFDAQDEGKFAVLDRAAHPEKAFCFNVGALASSADPELRQLYLQATESGRGSPTEADCKSKGAERREPVPGCGPGERFAFDSVAQACLKVAAPCTGDARPRLAGGERRFFLKVYDSVDLCRRARGLPH